LRLAAADADGDTFNPRICGVYGAVFLRAEIVTPDVSCAVVIVCGTALATGWSTQTLKQTCNDIDTESHHQILKPKANTVN
jgi:hypothetical protein